MHTKLKSRITYIDSLKGIAMCGVVMIHCGGGNLNSVLGVISHIGNSGVQMFFLLSSYLSLCSYNHYCNNNTPTMRNTCKWVISKFIALIPLYYFFLIIYCFKIAVSSDPHISILNILTHITFTHGFFPHYVNSIIGTEWYLGVLAILYCFIPFLFKHIKSIEETIICFIFCSIFCHCISVLFEQLIPINAIDAVVYIRYWSLYCFITQIPVIILGIAMFYIIDSNMLHRINNPILFSYTLLFLSLCLFWGMALEKNKVLGFGSYSLFGIIFLLMVISQSIHPCKLINNKIFQIIGQNTYVIFLLHPLIIYLYDRKITCLGFNENINFIIKVIFILIITLCISIPLKYIIDTPIVNKLHKYFNFL